jgi:hypothetical protein
MTDKAFPRGRFDPEANFVVNRPILISGEEIAPGTTFDKKLVDLRRLRQLYDQRYLRLSELKKIEEVSKLKARPGRLSIGLGTDDAGD